MITNLRKRWKEFGDHRYVFQRGRLNGSTVLCVVLLNSLVHHHPTLWRQRRHAVSTVSGPVVWFVRRAGT